MQDYVYAGLGKKSIFLMHLWLELVKKRQDKSLLSLIITKAHLLLKVVSYKQLQKSKKINDNYHISKNSNNVWQSWQLATLHIPVGKVKNTRSGSRIFQTQSLKGIAHLFHQCFYTQFSVRCNKSKILVIGKIKGKVALYPQFHPVKVWETWSIQISCLSSSNLDRQSL